MNYTVITPSSGLAVSLAQMKHELRILHDLDNTKIEHFIYAATELFEKLTGSFILSRTIDAYFEDFDSIEIDHRPNVNISSVSYRDTEGDWVETDLDIDYSPYGLLVPVDVATVDRPELGDYQFPVRVRYTVGYGTPTERHKRAIEGIVAHWYQQPSPVVVGTIASELPLHVQAIIEMENGQQRV